MKFQLLCLPFVLLLPLPAAVPPVRPPEISYSWVWPVDGTIVRRFDPPPQPWLPGHRGVDLEAPESSPVRAAGAGLVRFAGVVASRPLVSIAHPNGTRTTYEPVEPHVATGEAIAAGDVIGVLLAGHPGCVAACLHWGLRRGDVYLDPLSLLGLTRVRLLPAYHARHAGHLPLAPRRRAPAQALAPTPVRRRRARRGLDGARSGLRARRFVA